MVVNQVSVACVVIRAQNEDTRVLDILYAIGCTEGKLNGERNKAMYLLVRERFRKEQQRRGGRLELLHVKGHSGDIGNDQGIIGRLLTDIDSFVVVVAEAMSRLAAA